MLKVTVTILQMFVIIFSLLIFEYFSFPSQKFPAQPPDSIQSLEEADIEVPFKRAYFTNFTRDQVLEHYHKQFSWSFGGIAWPTYRLNYPPEDAYELIRDQTRSTFLEEIVHPFRESLYVNGFKPFSPKDEIWYKGVQYDQKITIKYISSPASIRIFVILASMGLCWIIFHELLSGVRGLLLEWTRKK